MSLPVSPAQRAQSIGTGLAQVDPQLRPSFSSPMESRATFTRTLPSASQAAAAHHTQIYSNPLAFAPPDSARSPRLSQMPAQTTRVSVSPRRASGYGEARVSRQGSPSVMSPHGAMPGDQGWP